MLEKLASMLPLRRLMSWNIAVNVFTVIIEFNVTIYLSKDDLHSPSFD